MSIAIDATVRLSGAPRVSVVFAGGISVLDAVRADVNIAAPEESGDSEAWLNGRHIFSS